MCVIPELAAWHVDAPRCTAVRGALHALLCCEDWAGLRTATSIASQFTPRRQPGELQDSSRSPGPSAFTRIHSSRPPGRHQQASARVLFRCFKLAPFGTFGALQTSADVVNSTTAAHAAPRAHRMGCRHPSHGPTLSRNPCASSLRQLTMQHCPARLLAMHATRQFPQLDASHFMHDPANFLPSRQTSHVIARVEQCDSPLPACG